MLGTADLISDNALPVMRFLGTGPGVLTAVFVAVVLIVWAINSQQPEAPPTGGPTPPAPHPQPSQELERLKARLRRTEQERDRYRALLADPDATRRREEDRLRQRCIDLAREVHSFAQAHRGARFQHEIKEAVERFRLRHGAKVTQIRDELDGRGWLTAQEREGLTLSAKDGVSKIGAMAEVLAHIGTGR